MTDNLIIKKKVYAYITKGDKLLVFEQPDPQTGVPLSEAGIQVPGGTVEKEENIKTAVIREVLEETGLENAILLSFLGKTRYTFDPSVYDKTMTHERYFFHFQCEEETRSTWKIVERTPSLDPGHIIILQYRWIHLEKDMPELIAGQGEMLPLLLETLGLLDG